MGNYVFGVGLLVSIVSILLWIPVIRSQVRELNGNLTFVKKRLIVLSIVGVLANIIPIIFDITGLLGLSNSVLWMAYIINSWSYRMLMATILFLIYRMKV